MVGNGTAYGCLFCETGHEQELCDLIEYKCPDVTVRAAKYVKHRAFKGVHTKEVSVFIPGYVFFHCEDDLFVPMEFPRDRAYRLLKNEKGDWRLFGSDFSFCEWLFHYDGLIGFSKGCFVDRKVILLSGPMKDMESQLLTIDKRGRSGLLSVDFNGRIFKAWLGFDVVDPPPALLESVKNSETAGETSLHGGEKGPETGNFRKEI